MAVGDRARRHYTGWLSAWSGLEAARQLRRERARQYLGKELLPAVSKPLSHGRRSGHPFPHPSLTSTASAHTCVLPIHALNGPGPDDRAVDALKQPAQEAVPGTPPPADAAAESSLPQQPPWLPSPSRVLSKCQESLAAVQRSLLASRGRGQSRHPDREKLSSVEAFFAYTEAEGRRLFQELDRDGDGQVTLGDLESAMAARRLPLQYARALAGRLRPHWLAPYAFGWPQFRALMEQREPSMLRAFNSLALGPAGTLDKTQVRATLRRAGLSVSESSAAAMVAFLGPDSNGEVGYAHFRSFLLLLPEERLGDDPSMLWFQAATVLPLAPREEEEGRRRSSGSTASVVTGALAGGLACALSTCIMHPVDTLKTRVQASSISLGELLKQLPEIGTRGLYRGAVPAIMGQFLSHGLRTGVYESATLLLRAMLPADTPALQIQSVASLLGTVVGTGLRIPAEVLKQRLQAGMYPHAAAALSGTLAEGGPRALFRGTAATLAREVPFYVLGMLIYEQLKTVAAAIVQRELLPWERLLVGALSGGTAAIATTPFDVIKTRTMTGPKGMSTSLGHVAVNIIQKEGFQALYKGAVPRFFWIAPLGAMNFAGYELAKHALTR